MKHSLVRPLVAVTAAALLATPAAAQLRLPPVTLVAGVGHLDRADFGWHQFAPGDSGFVSQFGATAYSLGVETATPLRGVDLRLGVQRATTRSSIGREDRGSGVTTDHVLNWTADAVVRLPHVLDARPYVLGGVALSHVDFGSTEGSTTPPVTPGGFTDTSLHLGAGLAWTVGRYDLFAEATRLSTRYPLGPDGDGVGDASRINWTVGVRIPLHR